MFENLVIHYTNTRISHKGYTINFYDSELIGSNKSINKVFVTKSIQDYVTKLIFIRTHINKYPDINTLIIYDYDTFSLSICVKLFELVRVFPTFQIHYTSTNLITL